MGRGRLLWAEETRRPDRPRAFATDADGRRWLSTGDVATMDRDSYVAIVDRVKDMIKSGGEWIASQTIERALLGLADIRDAVVIGRPHPTWQERPVAFVVHAPGATASGAEIRAALLRRLPEWQVPDEVLLRRRRTGATNAASFGMALIGIICRTSRLVGSKRRTAAGRSASGQSLP